ncbi:uncharacterized protein LOC123525335 [Mercenaria mercenaria]|uniref:uncharacterized protein LOC123525335 n=1 Tax=Mercenaria mercenaria TaxID=6596 RepID=UPI00234E48EB|nr:uncharacterized protein LOC123525335 [Mercenaria mercenaria]XP_045160238.2 uncharacterized protein LOC123525335 [Mercenaria mercenaria]
MPLRTLLGYEPRDVRSRENYGGNFISFAPARGVMATKKQKYQAPMARVKKLPPIDEVSAGTPRPTPRNSQNVSIRRVPRKVFEDEDDIFARPSQVKSKPILPVQPIPRERATSPPPLDKYIYEPKKEIVRHHDLSPKDVNHTLVDGLVADYLHYARYGHVIPVYEGTSSTTCPCCTDRNRQNVRTLLGFPKDVATEAPTKYDQKSSIKHVKMDEELGAETSMYPNSLYAQIQRQKAHRKEPTPEEKRLKKLAEQSHKQTWMNYQPLPYATNFLNPEFNRPSELKSLLYDTDTHGYMKHKVLEADTNFDTAMNKLSGYT